ncbi:MAG: SDR family NAD(P)-dependent oxidoreductase, partial [Candidatus Binatia bacterium]|nr:SDR family NAD(P)-dependent oxidoreductase [Candidatus Binatia bacterium]
QNNNARTIQPIKPLGRIQHEDIFKASYVNYLNYAAIINAFIKSFGKLPGQKRVVNITSGSAVSPQYGISLYCSAKAALEMLTMSVYKEQEILHEIKIMAIRPGAMNTAMQQSIRQSSAEDFKAVAHSKQLFEDDRLCPPEDVAKRIYKVLFDDKYWSKPILEISEVTL